MLAFVGWRQLTWDTRNHEWRGIRPVTGKRLSRASLPYTDTICRALAADGWDVSIESGTGEMRGRGWDVRIAKFVGDQYRSYHAQAEWPCGALSELAIVAASWREKP